LQAEKPKHAIDLIENHRDLKLLTIREDELVGAAYDKMTHYDISQIPVVNEKDELTGSINDNHLFACILKDNDVKKKKVKEIMQPAFSEVKAHDSIEDVSKKISKDNTAVIVTDLGGNRHIITRYDVIEAIAKS
jgi:cystathionine beta-synthase